MNRSVGKGLALIPFLLILVNCVSQDRELTLAVSTEEPAPSVAETIRGFLDVHGFSIEIEAISDSREIIQAIQDRKIDLALIDEPDRPTPGVVTVAPLYPSVLHVLYNRAEPPADFAELIRDTSIYPGPKGGAAYRLLMLLAEDFGVANNQFRVLDNPWTEIPDVFFIFGGLLTASSRQQLGGYRLFSFADANDIEGSSVADGIVLKHNYLKTFLLPRSIYYSLNKEPVVTLSIRSVLISHEDFDINLALEIASLLFNNAQEIAMDYALVTQELNKEMAASELNFPLHVGTRRFLDRDKPGFVERNVDVLALSLTVLAMLLSGIYAYYRHRVQLKKDRFDVYYQRLLELRSAAEGMSDEALLLVQKKRVLDVQQEVLGLLIDERIAADSNLVAFLSLSNQILNELDR